jgi:hypothetical protein
MIRVEKNVVGERVVPVESGSLEGDGNAATARPEKRACFDANDAFAVILLLYQDMQRKRTCLSELTSAGQG